MVSFSLFLRSSRAAPQKLSEKLLVLELSRVLITLSIWTLFV